MRDWNFLVFCQSSSKHLSTVIFSLILACLHASTKHLEKSFKAVLSSLECGIATHAMSPAGALKFPGVLHLYILVPSEAEGTQAALDPRAVTLQYTWSGSIDHYQGHTGLDQDKELELGLQ